MLVILSLCFVFLWYYDIFTMNKPLTSFSASSVFPILELSNVYGKSKTQSNRNKEFTSFAKYSCLTFLF